MPFINRIPDLPADFRFGSWRDFCLGLFIGLAFVGSAWGGFTLACIARGDM